MAERAPIGAGGHATKNWTEILPNKAGPSYTVIGIRYHGSAASLLRHGMHSGQITSGYVWARVRWEQEYPMESAHMSTWWHAGKRR